MILRENGKGGGVQGTRSSAHADRILSSPSWIPQEGRARVDLSASLGSLSSRGSSLKPTVSFPVLSSRPWTGWEASSSSETLPTAVQPPLIPTPFLVLCSCISLTLALNILMPTQKKKNASKARAKWESLAVYNVTPHHCCLCPGNLKKNLGFLLSSSYYNPISGNATCKCFPPFPPLLPNIL